MTEKKLIADLAPPSGSMLAGAAPMTFGADMGMPAWGTAPARMAVAPVAPVASAPDAQSVASTQATVSMLAAGAPADAIAALATGPGDGAELALKFSANPVDQRALIGALGLPVTFYVNVNTQLDIRGTLSQVLQPGDTAQLRIDNAPNWINLSSTQAPVGGNGWTYTTAQGQIFADGIHTFDARIENAAGAGGSVQTVRVAIDTQAPTTTVDITGIFHDTGAAGDFVTNDNDGLTINASLSAALDQTERLLYSRDSGVTWADITDVVNGTAVSLFDPNFTSTTTLRMRVVDLAGNVGATDVQRVTIDTTAPTQTVDITAMADDTDTPGDWITSDTTLTFSGKVEPLGADEKVQVSIDGRAWADARVLSPTSWDYNAGLVSGGNHVISARVVDAAGNASLNVDSQSFRVTEPGSGPVGPGAARVYSLQSNTANGLGRSMAAIDDFNGDGYTDFIVSAPHDHYGGIGNGVGNRSTLYLLFGDSNGLPDINLLNTQLSAQDGFRINVTTGGDFQLSGDTVKSIGDFNGDGLSDVMIASSANDSAHILLGTSSPQFAPVTLSASGVSGGVQGFRIGIGAGTGFNSSLGAGIGGADVNGDGYADVMISDPAHVNGKSYAYVIYGSAFGQGNLTVGGGNIYGAAPGGATSLETNTNNGLGTNINAVGDANNDGYEDYVLTMPGGSIIGAAPPTPGSAYLLFGGPNGLVQPNSKITAAMLNGMSPAQGVEITATGANERLGGIATYDQGFGLAQADGPGHFNAVTGLGDIDGSGRNAFAIGSPGAIKPNYVTDGAGAVYVIYDGANWFDMSLPTFNNATNSWTNLGGLAGGKGFVIYSSNFAALATGTLTMTPTTASDLGFSVASGDINADGIQDLVMGAPMAGNSAGAAFVVFGQAGGIDGGTGVVDLDQLLAASVGQAYGSAGTAIKLTGLMSWDQYPKLGGSNLGTDVAVGDFGGTGIDGFALGAWGQGLTQAGATYVYDGAISQLTQAYFNADQQVYYADSTAGGATPLVNGVDHIATGSGNHAWVHGIGTDTAGTGANIAHDSVSGGRGDDFVGIVGTGFTSLSGGEGRDTLVFEASDLTVNFADMGLKVNGFSQFDLNNQLNSADTDPDGQLIGNTQDNTLQLRLSDVISQLEGAVKSAVGPNSAHMRILGDSASTVDFAETGWQITGTQTFSVSNGYVSHDVTFDVWHNTSMAANSAFDVLIQQGVVVQ
ncbi:MAG: Ig-like domain-containing protein [Burkholderiaceae bacterium]|jgi:hypothetical protein|nr:Ig-like domain-containing protein [Burkholderiaceae bacterium]